MRSIFKKKITNLSLFVFFSLVFEVMFFSISLKCFLPALFFLDFFLCIFVGSVIFLFSNGLFEKIYIPFVLFAICACCCLNALFYKVTGNIFVLEYLGELESIFRRTQDHQSSLSIPILLAFVGAYVFFLIVFFTFNILYKCQDVNSNYSKKHRKITIGVLVSSLSIYTLSLCTSSIIERNKGNNTIDFVSYSPVYSTKKIGLLTYYVKNLGRILFPRSYEIDELVNYFSDSTFLNDNYTGILNGYNVVVVEIETGAEHILNEYVTPNLYEIFSNGIHCTQNYSANVTFYSELISIMGATPSFDPERNFKYNIPFTLPNLLNDVGYETLYCANIAEENDSSIQRPLMANIGYKKCIYHEVLHPDYEPYTWADSNFPRDSEIMVAVTEELNKCTEPFYMNHSTICMHNSYDDNPKRDASLMNDIRNEFNKKLKDLENSGKWVNPIKGVDAERYRNYTLCSMDTDKAIGILFNYLKEKGILDKTLLVVYGDHDCHGGYDKTTRPMSWQISGKDNVDEIDNYPTLLTFYNPKLNSLYKKIENRATFNKFSSPMVIVPTILDLLGAKYNPKFYQGKSIFDPKYDNEIFYSNWLKEFMNKNYLSKVGNEIDKTFKDNGTKDIFLSKCKEFLKQNQYIDYIFRNNIFNDYDYNRFLPIS